MASPDTDVDFHFTREFKAPRELVFQAMTDPEHLKHWWGPKGCTIEVKRHELRPGGAFHYTMRFPGAPEMWGKMVYREIVAPERIVVVNGFSDPEGNMMRHPMSPLWPLEMLNTTTLTEAGGKTTLTMVSHPLNASPIELATFKAGHLSMQGGFGGMYDQLDAYLASL